MSLLCARFCLPKTPSSFVCVSVRAVLLLVREFWYTKIHHVCCADTYDVSSQKYTIKLYIGCSFGCILFKLLRRELKLESVINSFDTITGFINLYAYITGPCL